MNQKKINEIYNRVYRYAQQLVFEELNIDKRILQYDGYYIQIYRCDIYDEDDKFVRNHAREIYTFMDNGYKYAGMSEGFKGCNDWRSLKRNSSEVKIARLNDSDEIICCSVYSSYLKGSKCVGLTITTNEQFRSIGKEALKEIIKYDINHYDSFYWCECSDSIERYYDKFDGFPIPNIYARDILEQVDKTKGQLISSLDEDGYHYKRYSKEMNRMLTKKIYGFNSPETFNKVIENQEYGFKEWENKIKNKLNESAFDSYSVVDAAFELVDIFSVEFEYGRREFPPYAMNLMKKYMDLLYKEIHSNHYYSRYSKTDMEDTYEVGMSYLEIFDTLVLYKFE